MPSRRQSSLTATSRRNPSSTIRTFSSGVYFRREATLTCCIKPLVCRVLASAASALFSFSWDTTRSFHSLVSLLPLKELVPPPEVYGFSAPICVPLSLTVYSLPLLHVRLCLPDILKLAEWR